MVVVEAAVEVVPAFGTALVVLCTLVFFMQIGFALIEVGSVRSKNATSMLLKNVLDTAVGTIAFMFIGYALCKGQAPEGNSFMAIDPGNIMLVKTPSPVDVYYLLSFACVACTIMSGALAERAFHGPYGIYAGVVAGFIFPTVAYWTWTTTGWLFQLGYLDTAGSSVVHVVGGAGAIVVAKLIGPRAGRYNDAGEVQPILGHSMPLMATGGLIIWLGCFSFNASSVLVSASARYPDNLNRVNFLIGRCCVNVLVSTSSGFLTLYWASQYTPKTRLSKCVNGTISGGVAICAGCMVFAPWAAAITGIAAGLVYLGVSLLLAKLRVDDPVDAVAVHFGGGATGILSVAFFANDTNYKGCFFGGWRLMWVQPVGLLAIIAWTVIITSLYWLIVRKFFTIRIPKQAEQKQIDRNDTFMQQGLDVVLGVEPAYPENYAMGDFLKFREFLETSWIASDARVAMDIFQRRQSAAGLSRQYYTTDASNILENDRAAYRARRGSVPNIASNSSQNSMDTLPTRRRGSGSLASQPVACGESDLGAQDIASDPPTRAGKLMSFFGKKGKAAQHAGADDNCIVINVSPPTNGVSPSPSSISQPVRARVPAPPLPPLPQDVESNHVSVAQVLEKENGNKPDVRDV